MTTKALLLGTQLVKVPHTRLSKMCQCVSLKAKRGFEFTVLRNSPLIKRE